mgnify:CR=1 FL=1
MPVIETLGCQRQGQRATEPEKHERGGLALTKLADGRGQETSEGRKSKEASNSETWLNPRPAVGICAACPYPEGELPSERSGAKTVREAAFERTYGAARGRKPRRAKPKSGTGMKQARQIARGARRREGAKPWGRNVTG